MHALVDEVVCVVVVVRPGGFEHSWGLSRLTEGRKPYVVTSVYFMQYSSCGAVTSECLVHAVTC